MNQACHHSLLALVILLLDPPTLAHANPLTTSAAFNEDHNYHKAFLTESFYSGQKPKMFILTVSCYLVVVFYSKTKYCWGLAIKGVNYLSVFTQGHLSSIFNVFKFFTPLLLIMFVLLEYI